MPHKKKNIPQSPLARASRLLRASATVIAREVGGKISEKISDLPEDNLLRTKMMQAQDVVSALEDLKGAAMKAGQLLSLEFSDMLPKEVVMILQRLHDQASFLPFEQIEKILLEELGTERYGQLEDLSREPIAAASIGQVHYAKFEGQEIALKVQYPGVAKSLGSDLSLLKKTLGGFLFLQGKRLSLDVLFEELAASLHNEVDYLKEANFLKKYRAAFAGYSEYVVPSVYDNLTTEKILALSFEPGEKLSQWIKRGGGRKDAFTTAILNLILREFFREGLMQTDPNYANFLWRETEETLVLLDFGATKEYPLTFRKSIRDLLEVAYNSNHEEVLQQAEGLGIIDARESDEVKRHFCKFMDKVVEMFRPENQPFNFSDINYLTEIRELSFGLVSKVKYTAPARQIIFLNRKLGGMYHLLKETNCDKDLHAFWLEVMAIESLH